MTEKKDGQSSVRTMSLVMIIMFLGKASGLFRDILFRARYGTGTIEAEAFGFASMVPRVFLDIAFASAISASFIPVFNSYLQKKSREESFRLANSFITIILVFSLILTVISIIFSNQIAMAALSLPRETELLAAALLRILLPTIILSGAAFSLTGILQSLGEFNIPAGMSIISNVIIVAYLLFFAEKFGVYGLAVVFLLGWGSQVLVQIPPLSKRGYMYIPSFNFSSPGLKEIWVLMLPVLISSWVFPINTFVNMSVASSVKGGFGSIDTASSLYSVIAGVFVLSIANVIFPKLSRQSADEDSEGYGLTLNKTIRGMMFFLFAMSGGVIVLARPLVQILFERNMFDSNSTSGTAYALAFFALGMPGLGLHTILSRGFYASKDGKTPMLTGIVGIVINAVASVILVKILGVGGPALASSISINIIGIIMLYFMGRRHKSMFNKKLFIDFLKMFFAAVLMAAVVYAISAMLQKTTPDGFLMRAVCLAVPVVIGVLTYILICIIIRLDEAKIIITYIEKFLKGVRRK